MSNSGNYYRPSMFGGFSFFPPVIKILLLSNALIFVMVQFFGSFTLDGMPLTYAIHYYLGLMPLGNGFWPWQLLTYQFIHAGLGHIFYNMFGLWMFGMEIEHVWGPKRFLTFYLLCGVVAGVFQLILAPILEPSQVAVPTVGASGAVYGVLIAFAMLFPDRYIFLWFLVPVKAKYFVAGLILLGVFAIGGSTNVANLAHLGGAFAGYIYVLSVTGRLPLHRWWEDFRVKMTTPTTPQSPYQSEEAVDAKVYDIRDAKPQDERAQMQKRIDEILDKISRSGYQNLTEEEKKILFEASKKLN
jgi:membrane associated rhomboid family serine protease